MEQEVREKMRELQQREDAIKEREIKISGEEAAVARMASMLAGVSPELGGA